MRLKRLLDVTNKRFNTFIGGIGGTVNTAQLLADKLIDSVSSPFPVSNILYFEVEPVSDDVKCFINLDYQFVSSAFYNDLTITYYWDFDGRVINLNSWNLFRGATALVDVNFPNVQSATSNSTNGNIPAFKDCTSLKIVYIPKLTFVPINLFVNCTSLEIIEFPLVLTIKDSAFQGCTSLAFLTIPLATTIESNAFQSTNIAHYANSVITTIGLGVFSNNPNLQTINLPNIISAGINTFKGCTALWNVSLNSLQVLEYGVFLNCPNLLTINLPALLTINSGINTSSGVFSQGLVSLIAPNLTSITGGFCFYGISSCTEINTPKLASIGNDALNNNNFYGWGINNLVLTVAAILQTINAGSPDGDIVSIPSGKTVIYI